MVSSVLDQFLSAFLWLSSVGKLCLTAFCQDFRIIRGLPMDAMTLTIWVVQLPKWEGLITALDQTVHAVHSSSSWFNSIPERLNSK